MQVLLNRQQQNVCLRHKMAPLPPSSLDILFYVTWQDVTILEILIGFVDGHQIFACWSFHHLFSFLAPPSLTIVSAVCCDPKSVV